MTEPMNVRRIAELARLSLTPEEEIRLAREMESVLAFARDLQSADVTDVPQTQHILPIRNVLRPDEVQPGLARDAVLKAAPACGEDYIAVPRTVE